MLLSVGTAVMCANTAVQFLNDIWMLVHTLFIYISIFSFPPLRVIFPFRLKLLCILITVTMVATNHIMGEGQGLQPVNFKIIKLEINGGNFSCNVRMMKSIRSVHKLFALL